MTARLGGAALAGLLLAAPMPRPAAATPDLPRTCEDIAPAVAAAALARDTDRLAALYGRAQDAALDCSSKAIACQGRAIARSFADEAGRRERAGDPAGAGALLGRARAFGQPWPLLAALGRAQLARARAAHDPDLYQAASRDLQEAINEAAAAPSCRGESAAAPDEIERLRREAGEAGLLSAHFVATPNRDGTCGGLFLSGERGLVGTVKTPVPVRFDYNQASLTADGLQAATALGDCIREKGYRRVVLSGHTDRVGTDAFNMELSARRLATVRDLLRRGGYEGEIVLLPKGKREPFQVDDPGQRTPAEIDQLDRRVEIREGGP